MFRQHDGVMSWEAHGVFEDGVMVGAAHALFPLHDNLDKVYFEVHVAPGDRGRGYGSALVGHVVDRARDRDRTVLVGESHFPADADESHPHRRFAAKHGFDLANTEMHRVLELPVDDALLRKWAEEAAAHHEGYTVTTHVGGPPEALLPSYVHLLNQLALDAPTGDIDFEEEALTVAAYRTRLERTRAQGRTLYVTVATVGEGDAAEAVAHSVLVVPAAGVDEPNVYQWATWSAGTTGGTTSGWRPRRTTSARSSGHAGPSPRAHQQLGGERADGRDQRADRLPARGGQRRVPAEDRLGRSAGSTGPDDPAQPRCAGTPPAAPPGGSPSPRSPRSCAG